MPSKSKLLWGIDLGGTKIEGIVIDSESESTVARLRVSTDAHLGYDHIIRRIGDVVELLERESGSSRPPVIGIGTPGTADPGTGLMKNCNTTALNGKSLQADLRQAFRTEFTLANDANCFALAEATLGSARGAEVVFGIIMGTGVGGGIVVRGQVLNGAQGIAGEWGHNVIEPGGDLCYCGRHGCVETVISGPSLERFYSKISEKDLKLPEIAALAESGSDPAADKTIQRLLEFFGKAAAVLVNILDPDVLVLGGGVGNVEALERGARDALTPWVFNDAVRTRVVRPTLGDSAGVFGAAMLSAPSGVP